MTVLVVLAALYVLVSGAVFIVFHGMVGAGSGIDRGLARQLLVLLPWLWPALAVVLVFYLLPRVLGFGR